MSGSCIHRKAFAAAVVLGFASCFIACGKSVKEPQVKRTIQLDIYDIGNSFRRMAQIESCEKYSEPYAIEVLDGAIGLEESTFEDMKSVVKISIPESVREIEYGAFDYCPNLQYISVSPKNKRYCDVDGVLYDKQESVLVYAPLATKLETLKIPRGVKEFRWEDAIYGRKISKIIIPASVSEISDEFLPENCPSFSFITVDANNEWYSAKDGVMYDKEKTEIICIPMALKIASFTIPTTVRKWEKISQIYNLTNLIIPKEVLLNVSVEEDIVPLIQSCINLENITIHDTVTDIETGCRYEERDGILYGNL